MKPLLIGCAMMLSALFACENRPSPSPKNSDNPPVPKVVLEREKANREPPLPPEVKIRLKRDGKDNYSWELSGSDADQILKVDEKLRKKVVGERAK